jgi:PAS domain S-box-containing protein
MPAPPPAVILLIVFAAGSLAFAAVLLIQAVRRRTAARRLVERMLEVRRHPLIGDIGRDPDALLDALAAAASDLVVTLREEVASSRTQSAALESLAQGPPDVALVGLDGEWRIISFSRGAERLTLWPTDEVLGQHVEALFAPGEWERLLVKLARRSLREDGFVETLRLQRRDGTAVTCRVSAGPSGGAGTLLVARDLGPEQELERRLRVSEERHRRLVEEVQDGVLVVQAGRLAYANPALATLLGTSSDALRERPFKDLLDARDLLRVLDLLGRAERGEETSGETFCRMAFPGQSPIEARLTWAATEFAGRKAIFSTVADLSERARAERTSAEGESRLRAALDAASDGLVVLQEVPGRGLVVTGANRALAGWMGLDTAALVGLDAEALFARLTGGAGSEGRDLFARARQGSEAVREAVSLAAPPGAVADLVAAPVRAKGGDPTGVILTVRDVTARVAQARALRGDVDSLTAVTRDLERSMRELSEARTGLQEKNEQLERLNTELRSLDEMKSNLLANVSHELHTPLVSIKGYTEMILKRKLGPLTPEQERGLSVAQKNIDRLIELIDNLLSFARLETGETQLRIEDIPLFQLVDEAVDLVAERIRRRNLSVTTQYESDDLVVRGDRVKLGQVFTNLLTNAVKFNRDGGRIAIAARPGRGGFLDIEVADTGIGIPPEEQEKIFERFYQVESGPKRRYEGTGIGLAIVRDILRLHGGNIRVQSTPGQGSTFEFSLPLGRKTEPSDTRQPSGRGRARE